MVGFLLYFRTIAANSSHAQTTLVEATQISRNSCCYDIFRFTIGYTINTDLDPYKSGKRPLEKVALKQNRR